VYIEQELNWIVSRSLAVEMPMQFAQKFAAFKVKPRIVKREDVSVKIH
jgi:hypothetical protein